MPQPRIAIATCARFPGLTPDDRRVLTALTARGVDAAPVVWNDAAVDWGGFDACLLRSPWDYHEHDEDFRSWIESIRGVLPLLNPAALVDWNLEKTYLRELEQRGVATIPTEWVERGAEVELSQLVAARGWDECVIKPTVDLGAFNLRRVRVGDPGAQDALEGVLERHGAMVQPFLPAIEADGELSLTYIDGAFSHAVRKRPATGDFRVQPIWGGEWETTEPEPDDLAVAERALAEFAADAVYARVDLVNGLDGEPCLIELELIDPNLYLEARPAAADALAQAALLRIHVDA